MHKFFTILLLTTCCLTAFAQKKQPDTIRRYLDHRLAFTNKANMVYPAMAIRQADHWLLVSVYTDTSAALRGYFLDDNLTIKDGPFTLYFPGNIKMAAGSYANNIKQGVWQLWYQNGKPKDSGAYKNNQMAGVWRMWDQTGNLSGIYTFPDPDSITTIQLGTVDPRDKRPSLFAGDTSIGVLHGPAISFYPNGNKRDSGSYNAGYKDGAWKHWYHDGQPESSGPYSRNVQQGEWEYYRANGTLSTRETYVKGKISKLECFDEQGNFSGNTCPILKPAVALGRFDDFDKYALNNMFWPKDLKRSDMQGDVEIEYTISKEGAMKDLRILYSPHQLMSDEVVRFFKTLQWSPAVSHNRPIDYTMKYKVPFYR